MGVVLCLALGVGAAVVRSQAPGSAEPAADPPPSAVPAVAGPGQDAAADAAVFQGVDAPVVPAVKTQSPALNDDGETAVTEPSLGTGVEDTVELDRPAAAPTGSGSDAEAEIAEEPQASDDADEGAKPAPEAEIETAADASSDVPPDAAAATQSEAAEAPPADHVAADTPPEDGAEGDLRDADVSARGAGQAILDADRPIPVEVGPATPVAEDVDLSEPVVPEPQPAPPATPRGAPAVPAAADPKPALVLLGEEVAPGTSARLSWSLDQQFDGIAVPTPVLVVNGIKPGPTLCLTAAVHGDELNGIEIVRRVLYDLDPNELSGTVIGVPIVNLQGFRRGSRYLPDRRDLNRFFPGSDSGSSASRIAHSFFTRVVSVCDALVDIHTGSFLRTNLPQLRADMTVPEVAALTEGFGATAVLHSPGAEGTLRRAAVEAGIPAVTLETGEPSRLQEKEIGHGTKGIQTLLTKLDMTRRVRVWGAPEPVYYQSTWVRADQGGLLFGEVKLGQRVREGQLLGTITDPITNVRTELRSPFKGRILGKALNQVVMPGFAAFRIGIPSSESELVQPDAMPEEPDNGGDPVPVADPAELDQEDENS